MSIGIEPLGDMVLVQMEAAPEKTQSGLLLPEEAREKMTVGLVIAIGSEQSGVSVGDRVIYRQYSGTKIEWLGLEYLLMKSEDIQAKVNDS
ncbi:MAG: co-chaperone GroES [Euryarchaeota archaeon]|nr:co-chaperone GroES [Euryarchaeota archaeon]|tara:strand:- start:969 stop:1241 length:273 start_codon:yes stop_codon:yes gene_type:complete